MESRQPQQSRLSIYQGNIDFNNPHSFNREIQDQIVNLQALFNNAFALHRNDWEENLNTMHQLFSIYYKNKNETDAEINANETYTKFLQYLIIRLHQSLQKSKSKDKSPAYSIIYFLLDNKDCFCTNDKPKETLLTEATENLNILDYFVKNKEKGLLAKALEMIKSINIETHENLYPKYEKFISTDIKPIPTSEKIEENISTTAAKPATGFDLLKQLSSTKTTFPLMYESGALVPGGSVEKILHEPAPTAVPLPLPAQTNILTTNLGMGTFAQLAAKKSTEAPVEAPKSKFKTLSLGKPPEKPGTSTTQKPNPFSKK